MNLSASISEEQFDILSTEEGSPKSRSKEKWQKVSTLSKVTAEIKFLLCPTAPLSLYLSLSLSLSLSLWLCAHAGRRASMYKAIFEFRDPRVRLWPRQKQKCLCYWYIILHITHIGHNQHDRNESKRCRTTPPHIHTHTHMTHTHTHTHTQGRLALFLIWVLILLYVCPRTPIHVSSYYYMCVLIPRWHTRCFRWCNRFHASAESAFS